jgi:hypothetical protein
MKNKLIYLLLLLTSGCNSLRHPPKSEGRLSGYEHIVHYSNKQKNINIYRYYIYTYYTQSIDGISYSEDVRYVCRVDSIAYLLDAMRKKHRMQLYQRIVKEFEPTDTADIHDIFIAPHYKAGAHIDLYLNEYP